jgi:hypothetical protein
MLVVFVLLFVAADHKARTAIYSHDDSELRPGAQVTDTEKI